MFGDWNKAEIYIFITFIIIAVRTTVYAIKTKKIKHKLKKRNSIIIGK